MVVAEGWGVESEKRKKKKLLSRAKGKDKNNIY